MKRVSILAALLLTAVMGLALPAGAGDLLPDFRAQADFSREQARYLGLDDTARLFRLSDVRTEFLLVNVFSLYCGPCRRDAPYLNEMYEKIADMGLAGRIKFLGLAAGNTPMETEAWRTRFNVPFPLISDGNYALHKELGEVGTPYFVLARVSGPGQLQVLLSQEGAFDDKDAFFDHILALTGTDLAARR